MRNTQEFISRKIMLSQHSPGKGELSGMQNPARLATSHHRHGNSVFPVRGAGSWEGTYKRTRKNLKTAVRKQTKKTHWKFICLCGIFQFWRIGKCSWGTFSSDFSDHLHYSAWAGLGFSRCKFSAKQPASAEPALLLRNKSAGFQTIRKGIPTAGELA